MSDDDHHLFLGVHNNSALRTIVREYYSNKTELGHRNYSHLRRWYILLTMKRPKVALDNYKDLYEFYKNHRQGKRAAKFLHGIMGIAFAPEVTYAVGAKEQIEKTFESGRTIVLASNHVRAIDPCIIAALPVREPTFSPLLGNTFIPSKKSIQAKPVVRRVVDGLGAVPVFRKKDIKTEADKKYMSGASRMFLKTVLERMNEGQNMALFPEGERNTGDPSRVQQLQAGIGLMVCTVSKVEQPTIVPMGISYAEGFRGARQPQVFIGNPSTTNFLKSKDVLEWLPEQLQACVNAAENQPQ